MNSPQYDQNTGLFHNSDGSTNKKTPLQLAGMARAFILRDKDPAETTGFEIMEPARQPDSPSGRQALWVGHSTVIVSASGKTVMTDPIFIGRASPLSFLGPRRITPAPLGLADLPKIDVVVISHNHYDHLSLPTLKELNRLQPAIRYFVPLGLAGLLQSAGIRHVTEMDWWQTENSNGLEITATPVRHWSSRSGFDRNQSLWAGWWIKFPGLTFYFAGDTGYSDDFRETRKRLGSPDLAAIPIGAYEPRDFMRAAHVNPEEAVQIFIDLNPGRALAVHWGTFKLTLEPLAAPPERLHAALKAQNIAPERFQVLKHGQKLWID